MPNAAVRLVDVMATLQAVPSRIRVVVLDACRNNPFSELKETGRGLAIVDAPNGSIVAYSTAPGTEAFDGEGKNSPYTTAFLRLGREPNLPIEQFFKKVRVVVNDVTEGKQTPWESSSLTSDFYFFGDTAVAAAKTVDPATVQASASANRPVQVAQTMRTRTPRDAYNMAIAEGSTEYYQEYVRIYPYDPYRRPHPPPARGEAARCGLARCGARQLAGRLPELLQPVFGQSVCVRRAEAALQPEDDAALSADQDHGRAADRAAGEAHQLQWCEHRPGQQRADRPRRQRLAVQQEDPVRQRRPGQRWPRQWRSR